MELAIRKLGTERLMFATEMFGTGKAVDPKTGWGFDYTVHMVEDISWLSDADRKQIFEGTARKVFSRAKWD